LQIGRIGFWDGNLSETAWFGFGNAGDPNLSLVNSRTGGEIKFFAQNTERLTIKPSGEVHINGMITHTPETRSYTLPGLDFDALPDPNDDFHINLVGIHDHSGQDGEVGEFHAGAHLPDGATLLAAEMIGRDGVTFPGFDMRCVVGRTSFSGDVEFMAEVFSDSSGSPWRTEDITFPTINNNTHAYWVHLDLSGGPDVETEHRVTAVRLIYSVTQPLP
jgi:hypothetical protein